MKALVVCKHSENRVKSKNCKIVSHPGMKCTYRWKNTLLKKDIKKADIIISIGGDGTALSASHFNKDKPVLLINDSPKTSVGALTTMPIEKLGDKLHSITKGDYKTENLERIDISLNGEKLSPRALNEVFIANEKAYLMSHYILSYKNLKERQNSSGILFSTGTGSTAWFKSSGGRSFAPKKKIVKMVVREPYIGHKRKKFRYKILSKTIKKNEKVKIEVLAPSVLAIDSIREFKLKNKDVITISLSKHPLKRII